MATTADRVGTKVSVHLNLTTGRWVVSDKPKGRKIGDATSVTLSDVTFKVSEAQRRYCVDHGARWVHAWAIGTLVSVDTDVDMSVGDPITYNPFRAPTFHVRGAERPVTGAAVVRFAPDHYGYAEGIS